MFKKTKLIKKLKADKTKLFNRLCYTCMNGNPSCTTKQAASCDNCAWRDIHGEEYNG